MSDEDVPLTLGTAGHIDHGKTALITLLTGKNTDRLREERERGISIELGYAELELPSGRRLSVVDVPGHERFVRTMVAGATGVDVFLLVVAADDGVMPQTREHVAILEFLGVRGGVVALTKADLVEAELLELARGDIREFLAGTAFAEAPVVCVSARDGRGIAELLGALEEVTATAVAARRHGPLRLPIDRVFTLKGIGTVVTGTIWQGQVQAGDELVAVPGGTRVVVRSVQVHDRAAETVHAGSRCGVNLRGAERLGRGTWLVGRALAGHVTRSFDSWVSLPAAERPLRGDLAVRLHHGTAQFVARISPLEARQIEPGQAGPAVVRLDGETALEPHDRFILRSLSPVATIAGGEVLDITTRRWNSRGEHARYVVALREGDLGAACRLLAATRGAAGVGAADLAGAGAAPAAVAAALAASVRDGTLESLSTPDDDDSEVAAGEPGAPRWYARGTLVQAADAVLEALARRVRERPERPFVAHVELAAAVPDMAPSEMTALLQKLAADGSIVAGEGGFAAEGSSETLSERQRRLVDAVAARVAAEPLAPPTLAVLADELRADRRALTTALSLLVRRGDLIRVREDLWFAAPAVETAREQLLAALSEHGQVTLAEFRDRVDTGRRNAQALLELFDKQGLTRRQGDVRVPRSRR